MFRNPNQRRFLFALDKDKQKGLNPGTGQILSSSAPMPLKTISPIPKLINPQQSQGSGVIQELPGSKKLPRFGKIKNALKGQFKGIK